MEGENEEINMQARSGGGERVRREERDVNSLLKSSTRERRGGVRESRCKLGVEEESE